jgi:DNA polymerase-1
MRVVADIETDDLKATKIHCIVCKDIETNQIYKFYGNTIHDFNQFAAGVEHWIGHNFISFDAPVLNKLMGLSIPVSRVTDTLILSQMDKPDREGGHSLKAWGIKANSNKIDFHNFEYFTEEMLEYCIQDVNLCHKVYNFLIKKMSKFSEQSIRMEHTVRYLVNEQKTNGFSFDFPKANMLVAYLEQEKIKVEREVHETMKPLPVFLKEIEPKYNKDGQLSKSNLKRLGDNMDYVAGKFSLVDFPDFNLGSRQQIAKQLIFKGWKPSKFTEKGNIIVDEEVLEKVNFPEAQLIYKFLLLQKRIAQINNWINAYDHDTGCIHGEVITVGANTNRMTHNSPNIAQTPASYSPYGKECRELFKVRSTDRVLVGCDASGLELRCLAHYMNDQSFTKEILDGDIHTANQQMAGLQTRDQAKTFIYALIYGAGPAKMGKIIGGGKVQGQQMLEIYFEKVPKLKQLIDNVRRSASSGYIRGVDGRLFNVRSEHAALNLLLQGMGAIVCKYWLIDIMKNVHLNKLDVKLVASIHDEYQFDVNKTHADLFTTITKKAIKNVEHMLNLNCPLDSDFKIGTNWSETH